MNTKEKLTIKNIKTFPSMEWGEEGGLRCDIYLKGKKIATYTEWGNGGDAEVHMLTDMKYEELQNLCYDITNRLGLNTGLYTEDINYMCAIDTLIIYLQEMSNIEKIFKRKMKEGWEELLVVSTKFNNYYLAYKKNAYQQALKELKRRNNLTDDKIEKINVILDQSYFENL